MSQINTELIPVLRHIFDIELSDQLSFESMKEKLTLHINHLISSDFETLVALLYRIDVSEAKLKQALKNDQASDAGKIIADLIIERQMEKIKTRENFKPTDGPGEKW